MKRLVCHNPVRQIENTAELLAKGYLPEYETIILDTFSELQNVALDQRVDEVAAMDASHSRYTPEGKDYQTNMIHMRRIAAAFRDVQRNVIFVCHETEDKDENGIRYWRPDLTPRVTKKLAEYCDVVARFTTEDDLEGNEVCRVQVRRTRNVMAKTRIKGLPTVLTNPTFHLIHEANKELVRNGGHQ